MIISTAVAFVAVLAGLLAGTVFAVNIETVPVGNPGNAVDTASHRGYPVGQGSVGYTYNIGKYEVTAGQYCEFLNAVAGVDTYALYSPTMSRTDYGSGITRSGGGTVGNPYTYTVASSHVNRPVNYVSWGDSARFANWLHNNQPTGAQDASTTERGAYTLDGATSNAAVLAVNRNSNWKWAVTSEDEWYKAAYYNPAKSNYYDYPTSGDSVPSNTLDNPTEGGSSATYYDNFGTGNGGYTIGDPYYRTEGGDHENSGSPYGTFDQGGNVWEWNDSIVYQSDTYTYRGLRGG